jgi:hypothetical protein
MLYSSHHTHPDLDNNEDPFGIIVSSLDDSSKIHEDRLPFTEEIRVLLPQGMKSSISERAGDIAALCQATPDFGCDDKFRALIRAFITKLPGTNFSGFKVLVNRNTEVIVSEPQFAKLMAHFLENVEPKNATKWAEYTAKYTFDNGVPKSRLLIHLSPFCSDTRREFVINGVRPYLTEGFNMLIDT